MEDDKILMIPLIVKENSDRHYCKIIQWLIILIIVTNFVWGTVWVAYQACHCIVESPTVVEQVDE